MAGPKVYRLNSWFDPTMNWSRKGLSLILQLDLKLINQPKEINIENKNYKPCVEESVVLWKI